MGHYTIPNVVERKGNGERIVDVYSRLLSDRVIYLGSEIDDDVANVVVAQLLHLDSDSRDQEISLYLNSPGGSMAAAMTIYDTLQFVGAPVATICVGTATFGAAVLLAGGSSGRRAMLPHAQVVLHQPVISGRRGTIADLALQSKEVLRMRELMIEVLAVHSGQDAQTLLRDTERDKILTAQQALDYGLIDRIVVPVKESARRAAG